MNKFIKISIALLLIFIVILTSIFYKQIRVQKYIKENNSFDLINVDNYDVFLSGENHMMEESDKFKQEIFTYLNKKAGVKNIIEEAGVCSVYLLNEYIQSGNEEYLKTYMSQLEGTMAYTREKYEFYQWLCEYNSTLDEGSKINIYGIDVEMDSLSAIKGIEVLIDEDKLVPKSLEKAIILIKKGDTRAASYLKVAYEEHQQDCEEYFGDKFIYFENGIKNLYQIGGGADMRDKVMMRNFSFIYSLKNDEKFFGQFGSEHIYQDYMNSNLLTMEEVRFATLLNSKSSPVKNRVYSILCVYKTEEGNFPSPNLFDYSLISNIKSDTFIELTGKNSPFYEKEHLFKESKEDSVTCDYIQGLMIFKNSKRTHAYTDK